MGKKANLFKKRLLPLLLSIALILQMIPMLAVPAHADNDFAKLSDASTGISYKGVIGTDRLPSLVVDGDKGSNEMKYFVVGNDQTQEANYYNPVDPAYWLQLDLGRTCNVSVVIEP